MEILNKIGINSRKTNDSLRTIINRVLYSNLEYPVCGNRYILASNLIFNSIGITDIDLIYKLAKVMNDNSDLELSDENLAIIHTEFIELVNSYRNRPMDI